MNSSSTEVAGAHMKSSARGASAGTSTAVVLVETFTLFLSGGASREEAVPTEDGWGSGERSSGKSELGQGWRWEPEKPTGPCSLSL